MIVCSSIYLPFRWSRIRYQEKEPDGRELEELYVFFKFSGKKIRRTKGSKSHTDNIIGTGNTTAMRFGVGTKLKQNLLGTYFHPLNNPDDFEAYKIKKCRYGDIFKEFLHGKFDKEELMKRMEEAEANEEMLDECELFSEINLIDFDSKKFKRVRHVVVD